jgi:hypothetical protein
VSGEVKTRPEYLRSNLRRVGGGMFHVKHPPAA